MKKLILIVMSSFFLMAFVPAVIAGESKTSPVPVTATKPAESPEAKALVARLETIKALDKSEMSPMVKKAYRQEVKATKSRLNDIGGGIYISAGAVIIILLVIIIIF